IEQVVDDGELLESLLARAAAEPRRIPRRSPRGVLLLALSVAAALLVGVLVGGLVTGGDDAPPPVAVGERIDAVDPTTQVRATVHLLARRWGTALEIQIEGAPLKVDCQMIAVGTDGRQDPAGSWTVVSAEGYGNYYGSTMIGRGDLREIKIVTTEGRRLVTVPVT
ncbi:MAG: hypothetical protein ABIS86_16755, partial [Streptosporangiaceae bacterium]